MQEQHLPPMMQNTDYLLPAVADQNRRAMLRRLRFPEPLESDYQQNIFLKSLTPFRAAQSLVSSVVFLVCLLQIALVGMPLASVAQTFVPIILVAGALLGISFHSQFRRFWQPVVAISYTVLSLHTLYAMALFLKSKQSDLYSPKEHLQAFVLNACVYMLCLYAVSFLSVRWMSLLLNLFFWGSGGMAALLIGNTLPEIAKMYSLVLLPMLVFLLRMGYSAEWLHRSDFLSNRLLDAERQKSEHLLLNILPGAIAERLKTRAEAIAENFAEATVLFADIVDFTPLAHSLSAYDLVKLLNEIFTEFDAIAEKQGLEKIKTIGDAYMAVGGLPDPRDDHAEAVAEMALGMQAAMAKFQRDDGKPLLIRIGINTGPVVAGVIGTKKFIYDLWGDTVNMASRMESHGCIGGIQVTEATYFRLREQYAFSPPYPVDIKGRGTMEAYRLLHRLESGDENAPREISLSIP